MKKVLLLLLTLCIACITHAQNIGIGTTTPAASAKLDIVASDKGILIPRMTTAQRTAITNPASALLVYDTDTQGFWYYDGGAWQNLTNGSTGWLLQGNAGTDTATHSIGTTDNQPLSFKINNTRSGLLGTNGNIFLGQESGLGNTTGYSNIAIGKRALRSNSFGSNLVAIGDSALYFNDSSTYNTAVGSKALFNNRSGRGNTAIGFNAMQNNSTGNFNTVLGHQALHFHGQGDGNTAIGFQAMANSNYGSRNISIGSRSLFNNYDGNDNIAIGDLSLNYNTSGNGNVAIGTQVLYSNDGFSNIAIGTKALYSNTGPSNLVAIGDSALYHNSINPTDDEHGQWNVAVGSKASFANRTGWSNTAVGFEAGLSNEVGSNFTAVGYQALHDQVSGYANTAFGSKSLMGNVSGHYNVAMGSSTLSINDNGNNNTAIGHQAMQHIISGMGNTAVGSAAFAGNTFEDYSGTFNTALGYSASCANGLYNAIAIGARAIVEASNSLVLGGIKGLNSATSDVNVGIGTSTPDHALEIYANSARDGKVQLHLFETENDFARLKMGNNTTNRYWDIAANPQVVSTNSLLNFYLDGVGNILSLYGNGNALLMGTLTQNSDITLKTNILPLTNVLSAVLSLNGYHYQWKDKHRDQSLQIGLLAQEVQQYFPELVKANDQGVLGVNYSGLVPVVIEAMKEQEKKIRSMEQRIEQLEQRIIRMNPKNQNT